MPKFVVSGAPGTGKTTVATAVAQLGGVPLLSLDAIKESLADQLGLGDEDWSNRLGDAAAEVLFRLGASFPDVVVEGWWRRQRRARALREFSGWIEIFCFCDPGAAAERMRARLTSDRHPIHRDVLNPQILDSAARVASSAEPLGCGIRLIRYDTTDALDPGELARALDGPATAGSG